MTFGEYDFLTIIEAPDEKLATLAVAAAGGGVTDLKTAVAVNSADMKDAFGKSKVVGRQSWQDGAASNVGWHGNRRRQCPS
jgi:GYD domain